LRDITPDNIAPIAAQTWSNLNNERMRYLLERLVAYVHGYAKETKLSHAEWLAAMQFLHKCGDISDDKRSEVMIVSDMLGLSSLVELTNTPAEGTSGSVLGPFYLPDSPTIQRGGDLVKGNAGDPVLICGRVVDKAGRPLKGASIDMWQTDAKGLYATQDPAQPDDNFRCKVNCDEEGRYWFTTVRPGAYTIPMDGPVGALFRHARRSEWRPAHYHFIVRAPGHHELVTELFPDDDPYLEIDAVFGTRAALCVPLKPVAANDTLPSPLERKPVKRIDYDFVLVPAAAMARAAE